MTQRSIDQVLRLVDPKELAPIKGGLFSSDQQTMIKYLVQNNLNVIKKVHIYENTRPEKPV